MESVAGKAKQVPPLRGPSRVRCANEKATGHFGRDDMAFFFVKDAIRENGVPGRRRQDARIEERFLAALGMTVFSLWRRLEVRKGSTPRPRFKKRTWGTRYFQGLAVAGFLVFFGGGGYALAA
jgi:hypothetical protein